MTRFAVGASHFVVPGRTAGPGYLIVEDGRVGGLVSRRPDCLVEDFGDAWVGPGLVDTHIHGFVGHSAADADPSGIDEASLALAARGTTAWLPTTFTDPVEDIADDVGAIAHAAEGRPDDFPGARVAGIYLEGPFFTEKHRGAQNPAYLRAPSVEIFDEWQRRAHGLIRKSALAPEYPEAPAYVAALAERGVVTCLGHSDATFEQGMAAVEAGAGCFVHTYNGMRGLHHREPGLLGCAMVSRGTYCELICDGRHVVPGACEVLLRARGWEHVALITDCLACGGLPEGRYTSGGMDVVLKDGLCYLADMSAIAGSVLTLAEGVRNVFSWGIATAEEAIRMGSEVPARSAGLMAEYGSLAPGRRADIDVFAPDLSLRATYVGGVRVQAA